MLLIVPTAGLIDHVTAVFVVPDKLAVNCCVCDGPRVAVEGDTDTLTPVVPATISIALILGFSMTGLSWIAICPFVTGTT